MKKPIQIEPVEKVFTLNWMMHSKCNYDCMYCPSTRHDLNGKMLSFDQLKDVWIQFFEKTRHVGLKYKISLTGGEPTINKNLIPFVIWLRKNYNDCIHNIGITTNGSASKKYYLSILDHIEWIGFSTHTEHTNVDLLTDKVAACTAKVQNIPGKSCNLVIMEEYWAGNEIIKMIDFCKANGVSYAITRTVYGTENRSRDYPIFKINRTKIPREDLRVTPDQIAATHNKIKEHLQMSELPVDQNYNTVVFFDDGSQTLTYASNIRFLDLSNFQGWHCNAGVTRATIDDDLSVYSGDCRNDYLGNLRDGTYQPLASPTICKRTLCSTNPDDLMVLKYKGSEIKPTV